MKDAAHAQSVLNVLRGTNITAPTTLYLALVGGTSGDADYDPKDKSTWTEITTTDCPSYARVPITFNAPAAGSGGDAGYQVMTGATINSGSGQYAFPAFNKSVQVDGAVLCNHLTTALSTSGLRGVDAALNADYTSGQQAAVTPSNVKIREQ